MFRIALSLSGGGFRATLFHLGVIRYLASRKALANIDIISSVSGGSLLAGYLGLRWQEFVDADEAQFTRLAQPILTLAQVDIRDHILRRLPFWMLPGFDRASLFRRQLNRILFDAVSCASSGRPIGTTRMLADLSSRVRVFINATSLTDKRIYSFTCGHGSTSGSRGELYIDGDKHGILDGYDLASAVAASAAFPPLFPPMKLEATSPNPNLTGSQWLSDGGVYDNLGIQLINKLLTKESSLQDNTRWVIISDAGRPVSATPENSYRFALSRNTRANDILMDRLGRQDSELFAEKVRQCVVCSIAAIGKDSIPFQQELAGVRTDLDAFSPALTDALMDLGFKVAQTNVSNVLDEGTPRHDGWSPFQTAPQRDLELVFPYESKVRWRLFNPHDLLSWCQLCGLVFVVLALDWWLTGPFSYVCRALGIGQKRSIVSIALYKGNEAAVSKRDDRPQSLRYFEDIIKIRNGIDFVPAAGQRWAIVSTIESSNEAILDLTATASKEFAFDDVVVLAWHRGRGAMMEVAVVRAAPIRANVAVVRDLRVLGKVTEVVMYVTVSHSSGVMDEEEFRRTLNLALSYGGTK